MNNPGGSSTATGSAPETAHPIDEKIDFRPLQLLRETGHASFALGNDGPETTSGGDVGILFPPLRVGQVGRIESLAQRGISSTVIPMTTSAVSVVQLGDFSAASC